MTSCSKFFAKSHACCSGLRLGDFRHFAKDVGKSVLGVWPYLDPWDRVRLRTASTRWNVPGKYGPHGELFFFLVKKEPLVASDVSSTPFVSSETLKACALIGLHLLAAGDDAGFSCCQSPELGDMWKYSCPKSPDWDGDVESWTEVFAAARTERGKLCSECCGARPVRCEDLSSKCKRPGSWDVAGKRPLVAANKPFSHRGRAATVKERDVVR